MFWIVMCALCFFIGRATAPRAPARDRKGRFVRSVPPVQRARAMAKTLRDSLPTLRLPDIGPQHLAVFGAACLGIGLAMAVPVAMAPVAMLAPLPLGVAAGRRIITPTKSKMSWRHLPLTTLDPTDTMWEDWSC